MTPEKADNVLFHTCLPSKPWCYHWSFANEFSDLVFLGIRTRGSLLTWPALCKLFNVMHEIGQDLQISYNLIHYVLFSTSHSLSNYPNIHLKIFLSKNFQMFSLFFYSFQVSESQERTVRVKVLNNRILANLYAIRLFVPGIKYYGHI
jgi:hypothetical protein